jgi:hypothetical protein
MLHLAILKRLAALQVISKASRSATITRLTRTLTSISHTVTRNQQLRHRLTDSTRMQGMITWLTITQGISTKTRSLLVGLALLVIFVSTACGSESSNVGAIPTVDLIPL